MDSSCKYPVLLVDAVSDSMDSLSLLKVPSDESIWPQRNLTMQNVDNLYQPESEMNRNDNKIGFVGFSASEHIPDVPSTAQSCDLTSSTSYERTSNGGATCLGYSDDELISAELNRERDENLNRSRNSSFHQMILRPKCVSPRHCIITLYDDSDEEESSDSDYTVDSDLLDSSSSDEYSSDSEYETKEEGGKARSSDEEFSDSDEYSTETASSDEEEMALPTEMSSTGVIAHSTEDSNCCDEDCATPVAAMDTSNARSTSEDVKLELSRHGRNSDSDSSSATRSEQPSPVCTDEEWTEEELTDDASIDLDESTEYSSEESDGSS